MADDDQNKDDAVVEEVVETSPVEDTAPEATEAETPVEESQAEAETVSDKETPAAEPEPAKKEVKPVSKDLESIIEKIEKLSVLELADLVHALEDRFGVTAAAPVAMAGAAAPAAAGEAAEEQTSFNVILTSGGANKIAVIKAVRELVQTLGLKEAKDLVEGAPKPVLEGVNKEAANEAKEKLTAAGGTVELQ